MMKTGSLPLITVDAFSTKTFAGNPAAVCLGTDGLTDEILQKIAGEMNLSETAFPVPVDRDDKGLCNNWNLRWMTPTEEVDLCGHATLATAVVLDDLKLIDPEKPIRFQTRSGELVVKVSHNGDETNISMKLPKPGVYPTTIDSSVVEAFGFDELKARVLSTTSDGTDHFLEIDNVDAIARLDPDLRALANSQSRGYCVTARNHEGQNSDIVSRFFGPAVGIDEDPVTGSAHCALFEIWHQRIGPFRETGIINAEQRSPRGGFLKLMDAGTYVEIHGSGCIVIRGELHIRQ